MDNKLHILFLCGWYPSRVLPTNGDFIQRHAEAVGKKHKVTILHIITDNNLKEDIEITRQEKKNITTHIAYLRRTSNPFKRILLFREAFLTLLKEIERFDVVHLNEIYPFGLFSLYLKWFKNKPFIISEHFTGYLKASNIKTSFFQKIISKQIVKKAIAICPVSDYLSNNMKELGFKGNFVTVPNVVDTTLFCSNKKKDPVLKLVHVSSLKDGHKNISGMLRVAKLLDTKLDYFEWKFIGGNGNEYKEYLTELNIQNGSISFLEHQTHKELVTNLQEASICISFSNYETFGIVIPEAIASGTPVISTETGVAIDFKNHTFCKVIPTKNETLLFQEILKAKITFANLNLDEMHAFVKQKFSKDVVLDKFTSLYYKSIKH